MHDPIGSSFSHTEHAARTEAEYEYKISLANQVFISTVEAEKANKAARANLALQVINTVLMIALLCLRVWGK